MSRNRSSAGLALLLCITVPFSQVPAAESTVEAAFTNLQYSLSVEWNQEDEQFRRQGIERFYAEINQLQKQGMTREEIIERLRNSALDRDAIQELEKIASSSDAECLSEEELSRLVYATMMKHEAQGASFHGKGPGARGSRHALIIDAVIVGIVVVTLLIRRRKRRKRSQLQAHHRARHPLRRLVPVQM